MTIYKVRYNFTRAQPKWTHNMIDLFGQDNTGFYAQGESPKDAIARWNLSQLPGARLNPFYLTIEEEIVP
jgi:hypothetical protein